MYHKQANMPSESMSEYICIHTYIYHKQANMRSESMNATRIREDRRMLQPLSPEETLILLLHSLKNSRVVH